MCSTFARQRVRHLRRYPHLSQSPPVSNADSGQGLNQLRMGMEIKAGKRCAQPRNCGLTGLKQSTRCRLS